jgi:phage head maturation protease
MKGFAMKLYAEITKIDRTQRLVFGYASTEALDNQGEIVRKEAIEAALPSYMRFANIREMHQPSAVGVAKEAEIDGKGLYLAARIVDDDAWRKVIEGVYKGFSIGGRVTARDVAAKHVITGVELLEISLVDRPANPEAVIELYKAAPRRDGRATLLKGMAGVQSLAGILAQIQSLRDATTNEADEEQDGSDMPQQLRDWLDTGAALLRDMVSEETGELTSGAYDDNAVYGTADVGVYGSTNYDSGTDDGDEKEARGRALVASRKRMGERLTGPAARTPEVHPEGYQHALAPLHRQIAELSKRLTSIEGQPLPAKGVTKAVAVTKEQDAGGVSGESFENYVARLAGMTPERRAHELTKLALRFPRPLPR